jgi:hypothetical protein
MITRTRTPVRIPEHIVHRSTRIVTKKTVEPRARHPPVRSVLSVGKDRSSTPTPDPLGPGRTVLSASCVRTRRSAGPGWTCDLVQEADRRKLASPASEEVEAGPSPDTRPGPHYALHYTLPAGVREAKPYVPMVTRERNPYPPHPSGQGSPSTPHVVFERIRIAALLHRTLYSTKKGRAGVANV